ncbi:response regulator [candidate division KSB1 bacterium]
MRRRKLLFVDDEENVLKSLVRVFQDNNYEILTASNGKEGLELVRNYEFQLVISDNQMPEMNGVEFLKQVRKISPDTIRIILTGYADVNSAISAINEGHVYKFMIKPWDEKLLRVQIKRALEFYDLLLEKQALNKEIIEKNKKLEEIKKNLEKIVEERTRQLLHSEKMANLGQMAGQIGHEIGNILAILKGKMQLIEIKKGDIKYIGKSLKMFSRQIDRLEIHKNNLLTLGKPKLPEFKNINLKEILEKTIENLMHAGILKYYTINKEYQENLQLVYGDASQVEQIFTNLFINSHNAMEMSGTLYVAVNILDDKKFAEVCIKDTGKGIREENLEKIFEPFFTTELEGKGTGLGLPVVEKIVESHNGYIRIKSNVNIGTTVILGFPLIQNKY